MHTEPSDSALVRAARQPLAHLPTPIEHYPALDALVGTEVWVKRDDASGGAEAGNKVRKLEYLMADALQRGADTILTCGGLQSNHARATAIVARRLGMQPVLVLRTAEPPATREGNLLLDDLLGAELHYVDSEGYAQRERVLSELADQQRARGRRPYVIPEGGSNGLGALGYVHAMRELRVQLDADPSLPREFNAVVHACGSGGTAAGVQLGARHYAIAPEVIAMAVCDDSDYFERRIASIVEQARALLTHAPELATLRVIDEYKGPAYAVPSERQVGFIRAVASACGLLLDPVYSGKALFGLAELTTKPKRALFIHTGGLPGLLAERTRFGG